MSLFFMSTQEHINRLLWNRRLVMFPKDLEVPEGLEYVILKDLTLEDRNYYLFIRDLEEHKARQAGVPTEGELMEKARVGGYWGKEEDDIDARADDHIAFLESEFEAKAKFRSRQNIIKLQIADAHAKKEWIESKRQKFKQNSAEYLAHEIACFKLLRRVTLQPDDTLLIPDDNTFLKLKEDHLIFLYYLIQEMMGEGAVETVILREVARSTEWRLIWTLSRENLPAIFDRSVGDFTVNHRMLIYWSRVYDSAFECQEPPEDDTVQDNDLFDEWLSERDLERRGRGSGDVNSSTSHHQEQGRVLDGEYIEKCVCGKKRQNTGKGHGEKLPHADNCQFGVWRSFSAAEKEDRARKVYGRNSNTIRKTLDIEQDKVLQKGSVEEQDLRGKATRTLLGMPTKVIKKK